MVPAVPAWVVSPVCAGPVLSVACAWVVPVGSAWVASAWVASAWVASAWVAWVLSPALLVLAAPVLGSLVASVLVPGEVVQASGSAASRPSRRGSATRRRRTRSSG